MEFLKELQFNIQEESKAISFYTTLLEMAEKSVIDDREETLKQIKEIISDELNHIEILYNLFVKLSNIEPNKE